MKRKAVVMLSRQTGSILRVFRGIREAGRQTGIHYTNIVACLKGRLSQAGGYMWRYLDGGEDSE